MEHPVTPDGRYFVHNGRLWRCTNPNLEEATRQRLANELMRARREVRDAKRLSSARLLKAARDAVHEAKVSLGERGPTWWTDDSDFNRMAVKVSVYQEWYAELVANRSDA